MYKRCCKEVINNDIISLNSLIIITYLNILLNSLKILTVLIYKL